MDDHGVQFLGPGAEQQAKELALELRKRYKLEPTVPDAVRPGQAQGRGVDGYGEPGAWCP